ncbi:MAG TPA: NUDIX hydrolase [Patescibacteria group bacterium]|nr:NUDIX hydrolase [Patescibacteria group bacterium]
MRTIERDIVGAFIFSNDGHILLGKSRPGGVYPDFLIVPGGGVELNESKLEALHREIKEELGLDISNSNAQLINDTQSGQSEKNLRDTNERVIVKMRFFNFRVDLPLPAKEIIILLEDDFAAAEWIPVQNLPNTKITEPTQHTLKKLGYL